MEFYICRAMDIARLNYGQIRLLHDHERELGRCLFPSEIRTKFQLPSLKDTWHMPDAKDSKSVAGLEAHAKRVANEIFKADCFIGNGGRIEPSGISGEDSPVHIFDHKIFHATEDHAINFTYVAPVKKNSLVSEVSDDEEGSETRLAMA